MRKDRKILRRMRGNAPRKRRRDILRLDMVFRLDDLSFKEKTSGQDYLQMLGSTECLHNPI
jgi:hypothetical protein